MKINTGISNTPAKHDFGDNYQDDVRMGPLGPYISRPPIAQGPPDFEALFGDSPKPDISDYRAIDNFNPDYANDPDVAKALNEIAKHSYENLMADTPELRESLGNLAEALDITPKEALDNYRKVRDYNVLAGKLPEKPMAGPDYLASRNVMAAGKVLDHYIDTGIHPAFAGLYSQSIGRTGPGFTSLDLSKQTFSFHPDDGFAARAAKHIGNFLTGAIGDHSVIHDTLGMLYTDHKVGSGYPYAPGGLPPRQNYTTGQISGLVNSFGRKAVDGLQSLGSAVGQLASKALGALKSGISYLGLDQPRTHQDVGSILEQRDKAMFGTPGQTLSEFRDQQASNNQSIKDIAGSAVDSIKDFGSSVVDTVSDFGGSIVDGAKDIGKSIKDTATSAFNSISEALGFGGGVDKDKSDSKSEGGGNNGGGSSNDNGSPSSTQGKSSDLPDSF